MERCVGNNPAPDNADYWAIGYKGDFYVATFDNKPTSFTWRFDTILNTLESFCTTNDESSSFDCSCESNDDFDVTCTYEETKYKTTISLKKELVHEDSTRDVSISSGIGIGSESKTISVTGEFLIL